MKTFKNLKHADEVIFTAAFKLPVSQVNLKTQEKRC